jgi:hypothetical protein
MLNVIVYGLVGVLLAVPMVNVLVRVSGPARLGTSTADMKPLPEGWSVRKHFLDKPVYNEKDERVSEVEDIVVAPDNSLAYAILNVGGFLGIGEHRVAVPVERFNVGHGKIVLPGATKDTLNEMPSFDHPQ